MRLVLSYKYIHQAHFIYVHTCIIEFNNYIVIKDYDDFQ
jgi:hypothetical protein